MFELKSLGFTAAEIERAVPDEELRFFLPVTWCGEDGYFQLDTSARLDLSLNGIGVRSGKIHRVRSSGKFEVWSAEETTLLGITRPSGEVTVFPSSAEGTVFGTVGATYFAGAILAFDPAGPHAAATTRAIDPVRGADIELGLVGDAGLPVSVDIGVEGVPKLEFSTLFGTATAESYITRVNARRHGHGPTKERIRARLTFPGAATCEMVLRVLDEAPAYAVRVADPAIGLVLGLDFLRSFLTVFDFRRGRIGLRPFPGAIDQTNSSRALRSCGSSTA